VSNLGAKELLYIVSPIILFFILSIYVSNFIQDFISKKVQSYTSSLKLEIKMPLEVEKFVEKKHLYNEEEILSSLDVVDLKISKGEAQKNIAPPPKYELTFIYIGTKERYAIINGVIVKEGDPVSGEERVVRIEKDRVLLDGRWGKRWIYLGE